MIPFGITKESISHIDRDGFNESHKNVVILVVEKPKPFKVT